MLHIQGTLCNSILYHNAVIRIESISIKHQDRIEIPF